MDKLQLIKNNWEVGNLTSGEISWLIKQAGKLEWLKQAIEVCNDENLTPLELAKLLK